MLTLSFSKKTAVKKNQGFTFNPVGFAYSSYPISAEFYTNKK